MSAGQSVRDSCNSLLSSGNKCCNVHALAEHVKEQKAHLDLLYYLLSDINNDFVIFRIWCTHKARLKTIKTW